MKMIVNYLTNFLNDLVSILYKPLDFKTKFIIFIQYIKLTFFLLIGGITKNNKSGNKKILKYKIHYPAYYDFYCLFREVFIQEIYLFNTKNESPNIIDLGGNIGLSVIYFKHLYPNSNIMVFEPSPQSIEYLKKNVEINNLGNVTIIQKALSNKLGTAELFSPQDNPAMATMNKNLVLNEFKDEKLKDSMTVETTLLSNYIDNDIDFLKIDIEGLEGVVIKELEDAGKMSNVLNMGLEYHYYINNKDNSLYKILEIFENNNFVFFAKDTILPEDPYKADKYNLFFTVYRR